MPDTLYRVALYDRSEKFIEALEPVTFYTEALIASYDYDDDYPQKVAHVERSLDGSKTWLYYDANERIDGDLAWIKHLQAYQENREKYDG